MAERLDVGDVAHLTATFTDPENSDTPIDPTAVYLSVRDPNGTVTTLQFGVDSEVQQSGTGAYYADISIDRPGRWYYRWWSTGVGQAADEQWFEVEPIKTG